jgi:hypothetical protein
LIEELAADGHTTGPEAAMAVIAAEAALRQEHAVSRQEDALDPVAFAPAPDGLESRAKAESNEPSAQELAARARKIVAEATANGETITVPNAVAQARRELTHA